jgi:hypothetical protein
MKTFLFQVQYGSSLGEVFYSEYLACLDSCFILETKNEATVSRYGTHQGLIIFATSVADPDPGSVDPDG